MIHIYLEYDRELYEHREMIEEVGEIETTGETVELLGQPTPAMRRAIDGNGDPCRWFVGTDMDGNIISEE